MIVKKNNIYQFKIKQKVDPLVSVIIPCYNVEEYIDQCLNSILDNGYSNLEIICVDDRSTDSTVEHIKKFQKKHKNIQLFRNELDHNIYGGACRNIGLEHATGKYVYFCDSDDYTLSGLFRSCVGKCEKYLLDVCHFYHKILNDKTNEFSDDIVHNWQFNQQYLNSIPNSLFNKESSSNIFSLFSPECWNKFYRLGFIQKNDIKFQKIRNSDDCSFYIKTLIYAKSILHIDNDFYVHRQNTKNSVELATIKGENLDDIVSSMKECYKIVDQCNSNTLMNQFYHWQLGMLKWRDNISDISSIIEDIIEFAKTHNWYKDEFKYFCDKFNIEHKEDTTTIVKQKKNSSLWDKFDRIICIHYLPYKERYEKIKKELIKVGILDLPQFEWYFTVPNSYYEDILISSRVDRNHVNFTNINYTINTLNLLNYCKINRWKHVLLIEDDFKFVDDSNLINNMISNIPDEYDVINFNYQLYSCNLNSSSELKHVLQNENEQGQLYFNIRKFNNPPKIFYTSCIAFSNKMTDYILGQNEQCLKPFDHYFINDNHDSSMKCYLSTKQLGDQVEFKERMKI